MQVVVASSVVLASMACLVCLWCEPASLNFFGDGGDGDAVDSLLAPKHHCIHFGLGSLESGHAGEAL